MKKMLIATLLTSFLATSVMADTIVYTNGYPIPVAQYVITAPVIVTSPVIIATQSTPTYMVTNSSIVTTQTMINTPTVITIIDPVVYNTGAYCNATPSVITTYYPY